MIDPPRTDYQPRNVAQLSEWHIERRAGSGQFVVSEAHGTLLFRIDIPTMTIWAWDKKSSCEVPIPIAALLTLKAK